MCDYCFVDCESAVGDITAGDFDKSDITGDYGTWNAYLGCGFLRRGNRCWLYDCCEAAAAAAATATTAAL